jgi:ABC-2 type transport system ATP-binding protein
MINIQNLHFGYGRRPVYEGLSASFTGGYVYGLFGRNGSGKSTLFRLIYGMLFPQSGTVKVNTYESMYRQPGLLQQIFMVPEELYMPPVSLNQHLKSFAGFYPNFDRKQLDRFVEEFEIPQVNRIDLLSYGQKKKLIISIGLAANTPVLLMDEPTNGLDILSKSQFRKVIGSVVNEGRCIIISTHQARDLENLIDRFSLIDDGRMIYDKPVSAIARELKFVRLQPDQKPKDVLYSESSLDGDLAVLPNYEEEDTKVDLELLYKALLTNKEYFKNQPVA